MISDFRARGATITVNTGSFTSVLLNNYDLVFIAEGSGMYLPEELTALQNWVSSGGGLFIEGDSFSGNFGDLVIPYGIQYMGPGGTYGYATNITGHPVTAGCDSIFLSGPVTYLQTITPALTIVRDLGNLPHVGVSQLGAGRVVVVSDDDFLMITILSGDNRRLANQAADWLLGGASFWAASPTSGIVPVGSTQDVTLSINAKGLAVGTYHESVFINSNDPAHNPKEVPMTVAVTPGPAPSITVAPPSFSVTAQAGDSTSRTLSIGNIGAGPLNWSIGSTGVVAAATMTTVQPLRRTEDEMERISRSLKGQKNGGISGTPTVSPFPWQQLVGGAGTKHILAWIRNTDRSSGGEYENTINAIRLYTTDYVLDTTTTTSGAVLATLLADKDIFLVPEQEQIADLTSVGTALSASLNSFVQGGKTMIVLDFASSSGATSLLNATGLLNISIVNFTTGTYTAVVNDVTSPLVAGMPTQFATMNGSNYHTSPTGQKIVRELSTGNNIATLRNVGAGTVIYIGMDFYSYNSDMARLLANAVMSSSSSPEFISVSPQSGVVPAGSSQNVTVKFNTKGLNVGAYSHVLSIANDDPFNNPKNVPADLTVTGPTVTSIVPSYATVGQTLNVAITGQNTTFRVIQASSTLDVSHVWLTKGASTITATGVSVSSIQNLTATFAIPPGAATGTWDLHIEQPAGAGTVNFYRGFSINPVSPPVITSVSPSFGAWGQSLPVSITGQNTSFRVTQASSTVDANHVWFSQGSSTINATSVAVSSATNLTANFTIPISSSTGSWNVNVEQPAGNGIVTLNNGFTVITGSTVLMSLSDTEVDILGARVGQSADMSFVVKDSSGSTGNLSITVGLSGTGFTLISGAGSYTLSPGQSLTITIRFSATTPGFARGTLVLYNNSVNYSSSLYIPVRGYGVQLTAHPKSILIDSIHGSGFTGKSSLIALLRAAGHTVMETLPVFTLTGYDYFVSAAPSRSFTGPEILQVQSFVNGGGSVVLMSDYGGFFGTQQHNELLRASGWTTGIKAESTTVHDPSQIISANSSWIRLITFPSRPDPLLTGVDTLGVFQSGSLTVTSPAVAIATTTSGGSATIGVKGDEAVVIARGGGFPEERRVGIPRGNADPERTTLAKAQTVSGLEPETPMSFVPVIARTLFGKGQIIVTGDMSMFSTPGLNPGIRYASNRVFALNIFSAASIETPRIISVRDVPNDNGKQAYVTWKVSGPAVTGGISRFGVWRKDSIWVFLKDTILAVNDSVYSYVAPTIYDSTKVSGLHYSVFRVSAHAVDPQLFSISPSDSGYSVDNLVPSVPSGLNGSVQRGREGVVAVLQWNKVPEKDLHYYAVYRSLQQGFTRVDSTTFIGATADTTYADLTVVYGAKFYYRIVAFDWSGNASAPSNQLGLSITSVGRLGFEIPTEFILSQNYPNPFNPATVIRYGVPVQSRVKIEVYNTIGQRVAMLLDDEREAGYFEVTWNASVASGLYIYRIVAVGSDNQTNAFVQVKKMLLVR